MGMVVLMGFVETLHATSLQRGTIRQAKILYCMQHSFHHFEKSIRFPTLAQVCDLCQQI
jgi:hypothetical protein